MNFQLKSKKRGQKIDPMHLMLLVWLAVELIFGVAMVQLYNKNSWLLMGVLMAEAAHAVSRKPVVQENCDEIAE
jgi:hypothetical protein